MRQLNLNPVPSRDYSEDYPDQCAVNVSSGTQTKNPTKPTKKKTCIYLLRHCQSEYNAGNKRAIDPMLTEFGFRQASRLQGHFDVVLCSPLTRAIQTLHGSHITYGRLMIMSELREWRQASCDFFPQELALGMPMETPDSARHRIAFVLDRARDLAAGGNKVLLIGHIGYFKLMTKKKQKGWELNNGQMVKYSFH